MRHTLDTSRKKRINYLEYRLQEFCDDVKNFRFEDQINSKINEIERVGILKCQNILMNEKSQRTFEKVDISKGDILSDSSLIDIRNEKNDKVVGLINLAYKSDIEFKYQ